MLNSILLVTSVCYVRSNFYLFLKFCHEIFKKHRRAWRITHSKREMSRLGSDRVEKPSCDVKTQKKCSERESRLNQIFFCLITLSR